jgi:murein tripeptide amidase MpaA
MGRTLRACTLWTLCSVVLGQLAVATELKSPSGDVPDEWLTLAERTGFRKTPRYEETMAYCRRLAEASPWVEYRSIGVSPEGRDMPVLIVSSNGAFDAQRAHGDGKVVVFIQNCIHAGEVEGKDASLMLVRDMVITKTRAPLLDCVNLIVLPIFSVDGHERFGPYNRINQNGPEEMGWRTTSRNLNLNRDYLKADAVEMRHWLKLWNEWRPDVHFDNHTTDGGDWQYDLTFASDIHATADPRLAGWLKEVLYPAIIPALEADGHVPSTYFGLKDWMDPAKGLQSGGMSPRFSTGYVSLRNRPSILVETHMLKDYRTRVIATYNIMLHTLELLNRSTEPMLSAIREADRAAAALGDPANDERTVVLSVKSSEETVPVTFRGFASRNELSEVSGSVRVVYDSTMPIDIETTFQGATEPEKSVAAPLAYIVPPQWTEAIEVAGLHGLKVQRLMQSTTMEVESYRFNDVKFAERPFEGRFAVNYRAEPVTESRRFIAGSAVIPLNQPDSRVAMHLFEPEAPDSLVSWGFFSAIFEQKEYGEHYVLEELARKMLASDAELKAEFERRLREDREFAGNRWARLQFFYKRSPYWDGRKDVYPVGRIVKPVAMPLEP